MTDKTLTPALTSLVTAFQETALSAIIETIEEENWAYEPAMQDVIKQHCIEAFTETLNSPEGQKIIKDKLLQLLETDIHDWLLDVSVGVDLTELVDPVVRAKANELLKDDEFVTELVTKRLVRTF